MPDTQVNKLFNLTTQKSADGTSFQGVTKDNFFMNADSIFSSQNASQRNAASNIVFNVLDENKDNILSAEELASLTNYMDESIEETRQSEKVTFKNVQDVLKSSEGATNKISAIKQMNLSDNAIKDMSLLDIRDILNNLSRIYADNPDAIVTDPLYKQIEENVPKYVIKNILKNTKTSQSGSYWYEKYGIPAINKSWGYCPEAKAASGANKVYNQVYCVEDLQYYRPDWTQAKYATSNLQGAGNVSMSEYKGNLSSMQGLTPWKADWSIADNALKTYKSYSTSSVMSSARSVQTSSAAPAQFTGTRTGTTQNGANLANVAAQTASRMNSSGWCLKGVNNTLEQVYGFRLSYNSAYQALGEMQNKAGFKEVTGEYPYKKDLKQLPAGAIVIWDRDSDNPHGHISIALGNGKEASDHIANQYTNISNSYHVFMPV